MGTLLLYVFTSLLFITFFFVIDRHQKEHSIYAKFFGGLLWPAFMIWLINTKLKEEEDEFQS
jgi:hypothetical protein